MGSCCGKSGSRDMPDPSKIGVEEALKMYYKEKLLPMEKWHDFEHFSSPPIDDAEFTAKPAVLLLGQYSVGKTSMIRYLLGKEYPGSRIGPEPTTDQFVVIMYGKDTRIMPGPALICEEDFPFKSLQVFGQPFIQRLAGAKFDGPLLQHINFIDTPGILSGEKQRVNRQYDFDAVVKFLADKVDRILLLFDVSKLDISDEFRKVLVSIQWNTDKIKLLLNKGDSMAPHELDQARGALMWNLGKVLTAPEVPKVFVGSFWDQPLKNNDALMKKQFAEDYRKLLEDLRDLPKTAKVRKINEMAKRAKMVKYHALVMDDLLKNHCAYCSDDETNAKQAASPENLEKAYKNVSQLHRIPLNNLPDSDTFIARAQTSTFHMWNRIDPEKMAALDEFIEKDVLRMIKALPSDKDVQLPEVQAIGQTVYDLQKNLPKNLAGALPPPLPLKEQGSPSSNSSK